MSNIDYNWADWSDYDNVICHDTLPHQTVYLGNLRRIVTFNFQPDVKLGLRLIVHCFDKGEYEYELMDGKEKMPFESAQEIFFGILEICTEDGYDGI